MKPACPWEKPRLSPHCNDHKAVILARRLHSKALLARLRGPCYALAMSETTASIQVAMPKPAAPARKRPQAAWQVWLDSAGRISPLRIVALLFLFAPLAIAVYDYNTEGFGARPLNNVIHRAGYWALIFLMTSLAITPLRRIGRFGQLLDVRRMIGVGAFV